MSARDGFPVALFLTRRKLFSAKANLFVCAGFLVLLIFFWRYGGFVLSFRLFLFFFPYLFLLLAQDMIKDEVCSGALENLLFLGGSFRSYLHWKSAVIAAAAAAIGLIFLAAFSIYGMATHCLAAFSFLQFAAGLLVGLYYLSLAGFLSFFFKGGTNVLLVILGQLLVFFGILLSAAPGPEWIERLASSSSPGLAAKLEFLALAAVVPNLIIVRGFWFSVLGLCLMAGVFFGLQMLKVRRLELRK